MIRNIRKWFYIRLCERQRKIAVKYLMFDRSSDIIYKYHIEKGRYYFKKAMEL